jgi:hypothetical protein
MSVDFSKYPPPPPWRSERIGDNIEYINDITKETTTVHPLESYLSKSSPETRQSLTFNEDTVSHNEGIMAASRSVEDNRGGESNPDDESYEFLCEWKEIGLMGNILSYTMYLFYFLRDKHFEIRFEGVNAVWRYSKIDGAFGPIDQLDLFVGAKINIFDRHLTITSTTLEICHLIDQKEKKMLKRKTYLQSKIETVGVIPVIRRYMHQSTRHITRASSKSGTANLRRLHNEICKLQEQLVDLGMSHLLVEK